MPAWIGAAVAVLGLITQVGGQIAAAEKQKVAERTAMLGQKPRSGGTDTLTPTAEQFAVPPTPPSAPLLMRPGVEAPMRVPMQTPPSAPMIAPIGVNLPPAMTPDTGPQPSTLPPRLRETAFPSQEASQEASQKTLSAQATAPASSSSSGASTTLQNAQMAVNMGQSLAQIFQMFQGQGGPAPMTRPQAPGAPPMPQTAGQFVAQPRMQQMLAQQAPGANPLLQQQQRLRQMYGGRYYG